MPALYAITCPTCGETYWKRMERAVIERTAYIETDQPSEAAVFVEFSDAETGEATPLSGWACANGHLADAATAARIEDLA